MFVVISLAVLVFAAQVNLSIIHTSDIHGNIFPVDYATGKFSAVGLAKISAFRNEKEQSQHTRHRYGRSDSGYAAGILLCESG